VGGRRPEQVAETIGAADWDLSPEEIAEVDALIAAREAQG
jgi:aryl-alcohol dehydrogenase-like predicted oxidoreductase